MRAVEGRIGSIEGEKLLIGYTRGAGASLLSGIMTGVLCGVSQVAAFSLYSLALEAIFGRPIIGMALGVIFAATLGHYLKERGFELKGLIFGLVFWVTSVGLGINNNIVQLRALVMPLLKLAFNSS